MYGEIWDAYGLRTGSRKPGFATIWDVYGMITGSHGIFMGYIRVYMGFYDISLLFSVKNR